jgi:protein-S-isoprenylcysteine O-methyltransferase Ste14
VTFFLGFFAVCLVAAAGRLDWTAGWVLLALNAAGQFIAAPILTAKNPELMDEWASPWKRDFDRVLAGSMALFGPGAIFIVGGLDLRLGWQPEISSALQISGIAAAAAGTALTVWAMAANRFFYYGVFRIAKEQGHAVCDAGPYRIVRHPGYLGAIVFDLAAPLILQAAWALIPAAVTALAIGIRTAREDRALQTGLEVYRGYAGRVKFRLPPLIW